MTNELEPFVPRTNRRKARKIADFMVQDLNKIDTEEDREILHKKLFQVNIRLLRTSQGYKDVVDGVISHMEEILLWEDYEDYGRPKGISGANVGIPFNIIGIKKKEKTFPYADITEFFINPRITGVSHAKEIVSSNCGSIRLENPINVSRFVWFDMEFFDNRGVLHKRSQIDKSQGGYTIQHEIEHNLGILITNKEAKI